MFLSQSTFWFEQKDIIIEIQNNKFRIIIFGLSNYDYTYYNHCLINTNVFMYNHKEKEMTYCQIIENYVIRYNIRLEFPIQYYCSH